MAKKKPLKQLDGYLDELQNRKKFDKMDSLVNYLLSEIIHLTSQNRLGDAKTLLSTALLGFIGIGADGALDMLSFTGAIEHDKEKGTVVGLNGTIYLNEAYEKHSLHMFEILLNK